MLDTEIGNYIFKSKYARWDEEKGRRETWDEAVNRYISYMKKRVTNQNVSLPDGVWKELYDGILNLDIVPSMRAFMTAGKAMDRSDICAYNCSYVPIDAIESFDEILYILCHGTGAGFSVERKYTDKLPSIKDIEVWEDRVEEIVVGDSKEGWADAVRQLISNLYDGVISKFDVSKVRPAGARLKTFGGYASGPVPLLELRDFIVKKFIDRANTPYFGESNKLRPVDVADIVCKIAYVIVSGGVRRSALICLSDLDDKDMAEFKTGEWWVNNSQRALANISAVYENKPTLSTFLEEWKNLYDSKSGERGIFNRRAAKNQAEKTGRREISDDFGVNPCVTSDTWVMTDLGPRQVKNLIKTPFNAVVDGEIYEAKDYGFVHTGNKKVYHLSTKEGFNLRLTGNHKVLKANGEWCEADNLSSGDKIVINNHRSFTGWGGKGNFEQGWLVGEFVGDGNVSGNQAQVKFWGESKDEMMSLAVPFVKEHFGGRSDLTGHSHKNYNVVSSSKMMDFAKEYSIEKKQIGSDIESASSDFTRGFLRGLFDADGSVQGNHIKGNSIRLSQTNIMNLKAVQRMLLRFGIKSVIYESRRPEGYRKMPDGKGGSEEFWCKEQHELCITRDSMLVFRDTIGFYEPEKAKRLNDMISSFTRRPYKSKFEVTVSSIIEDGFEDVYDCTVPEVSAFDANGLYVHNCAEIILRPMEFCNLSEVIVRETDDLDSLKRKVRLATIIGTIQSTLTNFPRLRPEWQKNCEEERLLGVSLTGVYSNRELYSRNGRWMQQMKQVAVDTNKQFAEIFGINQSTSVTTCKPSGTVSQLAQTSSGIHPWHSEYYIRSFRGNKVEPMTAFLEDQGVPCEDDLMNPSAKVFYFPVAAPESARTREQVSALEHITVWRTFKDHWTEHNPSVTVNVDEHEWLQIAEYVYRNFDELCGVSFLPYDGGSYRQAPFQETDRETYEELMKKMPKINWDALKYYEQEDTTDNQRELSCVAGACLV